MALYLVQHGVSHSKEADPERGLTARGIADTKRIAEVARGYGVRLSAIRHSGKKRAAQTAEIFAEALRPPAGTTSMKGIAPLDDVLSFAGSLNPGDDLMLVGHLPFMSRLASYLIVRSPESTVFRFQNSGIVCLDRDPGEPSWFIKWSLMPKIG